jgi:NAD(P)-dependent dehydrogenase (short-subunit alcohol dehydrogenase family)
MVDSVYAATGSIPVGRWLELLILQQIIMDLQGKVALVTGGTRGIGAAAAIAMAQRGADVAIVGRNEDDDAVQTKAALQATGRRSIMLLADMGKPEDATRVVQETVEQLGTLDVLVHSAGTFVPGGLLEIQPEAWHQAFNVHVHAIYYLCRAVIPIMREKKEGVVILISSVAALRGLPFGMAYQVVKGALPQFARAMAREFAPDNIRVNAIAPGIIRTRFHAHMTPQQYQLNIEHRIPLRREGTSEQVGSLIAEVVQNDYITGETYTIDGGLTMRMV